MKRTKEANFVWRETQLQPEHRPPSKFSGLIYYRRRKEHVLFQWYFVKMVERNRERDKVFKIGAFLYIYIYIYIYNIKSSFFFVFTRTMTISIKFSSILIKFSSYSRYLMIQIKFSSISIKKISYSSSNSRYFVKSETFSVMHHKTCWSKKYLS